MHKTFDLDFISMRDQFFITLRESNKKQSKKYSSDQGLVVLKYIHKIKIKYEKRNYI